MSNQQQESIIDRKKLLFWTLSGVIFISVFIGTFYSRSTRLKHTSALSIDQQQTLYLEEQENLNGLLEKLDSMGWIRYHEEFRWAGRLFGWDRFKRGRYELTDKMGYQDLFIKLGRGYQDAQSVTILPGQSLGRFLERMGDRFAFDSTAIAAVFEDTTYLKNDSLIKQQLFGRMLPETYRFYWTETPRSVIDKIRAEFQKQVAQGFEERLNSIDLTLSEIVTLASIIEWEAHQEKEKPIISGLYWNRLNRGMRLQADPTVLYAIGEKRRLYFKDYKVEHPYNTYIHRGLPPGPITNPSLNSIKAALFPDDHDFLFMVATPKGSHLFSETFAEHKRKSREWRKWIQKQYQLKRQREAKSNN